MSSYWPFDPSPYDDHIKKYGAQYGVDPILLRLMAQRESAFNPSAVSPKNARGLFQVLPETARGMGFDPANLFDPRVNTEAGAKYMAEQMKTQGGDVRLALAAYNAGPGNVRKYKGIPPFTETQKYATGIGDEYDRLNAGRGTRERLYGEFDKMQARAEQRKIQVRTPQAQPQPEVGDESRAYYNPYPKGSKRWSETVLAQGGLPAIKPSGHKKASPFPGAVFPEKGPFTEFDETYPIQFKGRVSQVIDADTIEIEEMGTGEIRRVRLPDIDAAETDRELIRNKHPGWSEAQITEQLENGIASKQYMMGLLQPGDQLTVETKAGNWTGKYGRDIAKLYFTDKQGNTLDLSTPFAPTDDTVVKTSDPLLGSEGAPGWMGGIASALGQDAIEMGQIYWNVRELIDYFDGEDDYDPYKESQAYRGLERWRRKLAEKQAAWVSAGYDPDAKVFDIPVLGRLTGEELFKAGLTATVYAVGVIPTMGQLTKVGKGVDLAMQAGKGYKAAQMSLGKIQDLSEMGKRVNKQIAKSLKVGDRLTNSADQYIEESSKTLTMIGKYMQTVVEHEPNISAMQRVKLYKDLFLSQWKSKTHPLEAMAKHTGHSQEMRHIINQIRAAADVTNSPLMDGVMLWEKMADGTMMPGKVSEPFAAIWQGIHGTEQHLAMGYMASDRMVEIWNYQNKLIKKHGSVEAAKQFAKSKSMRWIDMSEESVKHHIDVAQRVKALFRNFPLYDDADNLIGNHWDGAIRQTPAGSYGKGGMAERVSRTREWSIKASLDVVEDVGAISAKQKAQILELNQHHSPWNRMNLGFLEAILPDETIQSILHIESQMLHAGKHAALAGRGLSELSMKGSPVSKLGKGLEIDELADMIIDPLQTYITRIPALNKWANQQRARNLMGEMLDDLGARSTKEPVSFMEKWVKSTIMVVDESTEEGRRAIEKLRRSPLASGFIRYVKNSDKTTSTLGYITHDPALAIAIQSLDPAHMSLFKTMTQSGWGKIFTGPTNLFRTGTVLGLHFMARNPMRDQFMAATLTKYGYVPVVDWWRGMFHVVSRSPLYEQARMGGGTQATFTAATWDRARDVAQDVQTGETLTKYLRRIFGPSHPPNAGTHAEAIVSPMFGTKKGLGGLTSAIRNTWTGAKIGARANEGGIMVGPKLGAYGLRKISETFEEATRIGAYAKAVKRAKKGVKYTFTRSLDEAMGGASGWYKMVFDSKHRAGFGKRWQQARHYSPDKAARMKKTGVYLDPDMVDEIRNITLDFQQRGYHAEVLNGLYPFFNAELQDYARFSRAMAEAPLTTMLRGFTFVSIPAMANWYMNFDNPLYHQEPEIERELFLHPFGFNPEYKKFQRISRPIGTVSGFFGLLPHKYLDYMAANNPAFIKALEEKLWPGKDARTARNAFIEGMHETSAGLEDDIPGWARGLMYTAAMGNIPMAATGELGERVDNGNPKYRDVPGGEFGMDAVKDYISTNTAARYFFPRRRDLTGLITSITPQAGAPIVQAGLNYDPFYDRAIQSPSDMNKSMLPPDYGDELTSPLDRALAGGLNTILRLNLTPQQAAHIYRRYTGSIGSMVMGGLNKFGKEQGLFPEQPGVAKDFSEQFLTKAFHSREPYGSNSDSVRQLYKTWEKDSKAIGSMDFAIKNGNIVRLLDIMHDHPEIIPAGMLQDAIGEMSEFYSLRDEIRTLPGITDEERADYLLQIDQAMTMYAHEMMRLYWTLSRDPDISFGLIGLQ